MPDHEHLRIEGWERAYPYTSRGGGGGGGARLPERDRRRHARKLLDDLFQASAGELPAAGITLDFRGEPGFELTFESLEYERSGIHLDNVRQVDGLQVATVFVPAGKLSYFIKRVEAYAERETQKGRPKNEPLIASISAIRPAALQSFWTDAADLYPDDEETRIWWEVWLRRGHSQAVDELLGSFRELAQARRMTVDRRRIVFPERVVVLALASIRQWTGSLTLMNLLAELRRAKELVTPLLDLRPSEQAAFIQDALHRLQGPPDDAPAVCLLDTGIAQDHPLLEPALPDGDAMTVEPDWLPGDHHGHGTRMAGIALYGTDLAEFLASRQPRALVHGIESVKLLPPHGENDPGLYGAITQEATARAETQNPRRGRVSCMAVTADDRDEGRPTAWSAAVDEHSSGYLDDQRRLYVLAAGNIDVVNGAGYEYPRTNFASAVQDPAQAWNALTVGAFTDKVIPGEEGYGPVADAGGLCPSSRTSRPWTDETWPYKPDLCAEGGNYAKDDLERIDHLPDLQLLTTARTVDGRLLGLMADTSAATAQVARMAAILQARYQALWPETIRALLVHSARWTRAMEQMLPGSRKEEVRARLRCFGYGVPNLGRAVWSRENNVCLVYEGALQPFRLDGSEVKTNEFHVHRLPWPREALEALGGVLVTVRATLSYFVEPSPGNRGWGAKHSYQSHGLRFEMLRPGETEQAFRHRVSKPPEDEEPVGEGAGGSTVDWAIGPKSRERGSLHSDWWTGTGAAVAACGQLAVYPVHGWWSRRKHLERYDRQARYSLVVSLETAAVGADLYTPIANVLGVPVVAAV